MQLRTDPAPTAAPAPPGIAALSDQATGPEGRYNIRQGGFGTLTAPPRSIWSAPIVSVQGLAAAFEPTAPTAGSFSMFATSGYLPRFATANAAIDAARAYSTLHAFEHFPALAVLDAGDGAYTMNKTAFEAEGNGGGFTTLASHHGRGGSHPFGEQPPAGLTQPTFTAHDPRVVALVDAFRTVRFRDDA